MSTTSNRRELDAALHTLSTLSAPQPRAEIEHLRSFPQRIASDSQALSNTRQSSYSIKEDISCDNSFFVFIVFAVLVAYTVLSTPIPLLIALVIISTSGLSSTSTSI